MNIHLIAVGNRMPDWVNSGYAEYAKRLKERVDFMVEFIRVWKTIPVPPAFLD